MIGLPRSSHKNLGDSDSEVKGTWEGVECCAKGIRWLESLNNASAFGPSNARDESTLGMA